MNDKRDKIIYWVATGLLSIFMLFSASMYILNNEMVSEIFTSLGFPTYIIYPLAVLKILALIAIWTRKSEMLKEWAYAGLFFDFVLASSAHINVNDGEYALAFVAMGLLIVSYVFGKKVHGASPIS